MTDDPFAGVVVCCVVCAVASGCAAPRCGPFLTAKRCAWTSRQAAPQGGEAYKFVADTDKVRTEASIGGRPGRTVTGTVRRTHQALRARASRNKAPRANAQQQQLHNNGSTQHRQRHTGTQGTHAHSKPTSCSSCSCPESVLYLATPPSLYVCMQVPCCCLPPASEPRR